MSARLDDALDVAERFFTAVESGDLEAVRAIYAPDARIWHNHDRKEQTVEENLKVLAWVARHLPSGAIACSAAWPSQGALFNSTSWKAKQPAAPFPCPPASSARYRVAA